jgi:hypothetical protein
MSAGFLTLANMAKSVGCLPPLLAGPPLFRFDCRPAPVAKIEHNTIFEDSGVYANGSIRSTVSVQQFIQLNT